jgi:hypothetical protein
MRHQFRRGVPPPHNEATWALGRLPDRTYIHATFRLAIRESRDFGQPARYVVKVFDEPTERLSSGDANDLEWMEDLVQSTPAGRKQIKLQIARAAGQVRQLEIERVTTTAAGPNIENILTLDRDGATRLIELIRALNYIPVEGKEGTVRIDDKTVREFFADPDAVARLYRRDPAKFRELIRDDASADDLVALAHRKAVVERFRALLTEPSEFDAARAECGGEPERVWQRFLEENPWILGISLAGQLLTAWDNRRLEQVVAGSSVAGPGKRADALLRTSGRIRSLVFTEIKHHETPLLGGSEYRPGCWPPSSQLTGGVTQVQQTVDRAVHEIGRRLADTDEQGAETGEATWLIRPRSYLILGNLDQLRGPGGIHQARHQSFELYRRNLYEPEILTFDELLARAEWHVALAADESAT